MASMTEGGDVLAHPIAQLRNYASIRREVPPPQPVASPLFVTTGLWKRGHQHGEPPTSGFSGL